MNRLKNFKNRLFLKGYYLILIGSILVSSPLYVNGLYNAHDITNHVYRIIGTVVALKSGQFPPAVDPNLAGGFGYGWNLFYGPLSAYIPALFKIFLPTYIGSLKLFIFLTVLLSGIFMFHFVKEYTKSDNVGVLAALLYITAPYRIVDIFIRGAMGEVLSFVFIPLLFHGLYNLLRSDGRKWYLITMGGAGLILSHNISALLCFIVAVLFTILNLKSLSNLKVVLLLLLNAFYITGITLFFIIPLLEQKIYSNYVVFLPDRMGSPESMYQNSVYLHQLLFGKFQWGASFGLDTITNEMPFTIGLEIVLPLLLTPLIYKKLNKERYTYLVFSAIGVIATIATTNLFPWTSMPRFSSFIQFPWRILMIIIFFFSVIASQNLSLLFIKFEIKHIAIIMLIIFVYISPLISLTDNNPTITDANYNSTAITEANVQASGDRAFNDYLPLKAFNHLDYLAHRSDKVIKKSGDIKIYKEVNRQGNITFSFSNTKQSSVELPLLYYVGYNAKLLESQKKITLHTSQTKNGFVGLQIPKNCKCKISVAFTGTFIDRISYIVSLLMLISFVFNMFVSIRKCLAKDKVSIA